MCADVVGVAGHREGPVDDSGTGLRGFHEVALVVTLSEVVHLLLRIGRDHPRVQIVVHKRRIGGEDSRSSHVSNG